MILRHLLVRSFAPSRGLIGLLRPEPQARAWGYRLAPAARAFDFINARRPALASLRIILAGPSIRRI